MNDQDLDQCYSALCEALARQGPDRAPMLLAMVCLSLISRMDHASEVLPLIAQAQAAAQDGAA